MNESPETAVYEIRIAGHLSPQRAAQFAGLTVTLDADGTTLLSGPLPDQAALHGLLARIRDLGLPLLSVQRRQEKSEEAQEGDNHEAHT